MKKFALLPLALLCAAGTALADDQLRNVQTELKNQGFFYGEVTGQLSPESTSAIRRYQIRNGLEVTGTINAETLAALGMGPKAASKAPAPAPVPQPKPAPSPVAPPPPVEEKKGPPVNLRRDSTVEQEDRDFLRREEGRGGRAPEAASPLPPPRRYDPADPSVVNPPTPLEAPAADFPVLFAGTPYASAPPTVQQQTLRRAQALMASRGFYRDIVDGLPGPATEEAILSYQRAHRMTLTGRLDLDTLAQMRLLPGNTAGGFREPQRTFRGIWVDKDRDGLRFGFKLD